jgi:hypothetical protein
MWVVCVMRNEIMGLVQTVVTSTQTAASSILHILVTKTISNPNLVTSRCIKYVLGWDNITKLQNLRLTPEHHKWLKLEKHATCPENTHFIPPLSLLYPSNNYITGNRRGYEYEFITGNYIVL